MSEPSFSLSSVLPASRPRRPRWVVPVIALLAVVALAAVGVAAWALTRPGPAAAPAPVVTTVAPAAVLPLGGPAAAACHAMETADPSNLLAMASIGDMAGKVEDNDDVRIVGTLLGGYARTAIAADGQPDGAERRAQVAAAARQFRDACVRQHYLAS